MKLIKLPHILIPSLLVTIGLLSVGCGKEQETFNPDRLTIGVVSYGDGAVSLEKYQRFKDYIATQTKTVVELEPAYNELQAVEQVQRKNWEIVFAPPGLAAIAISKSQYTPLFSMEGVSSTQRSLLIVRDDKPIQKIGDLGNKIVALGETGSAAGFYVPLYDLYGLTLLQIRSAPTPKAALGWVNDQTADAAALSERDYEIHRREFPTTKFRVLRTSRWIPSGVVLLGPTVERNRQQQIQKIMREAPPDIAGDAGYVPAAKIPNYDQFIQLVEKVRPLEEKVKSTPVTLLYQPTPNAVTTTIATPTKTK
jgi:phosphonate transport system substrate-binding protein